MKYDGKPEGLQSAMRQLWRGATVAIVLAACSFDLPNPPPHSETAAPTPYSGSTISMSIGVDVTNVRDKLITELKARPLVEGNSPDLSIRLLAEEKSIFDEPQKIVDVPYKAAFCQIEKVSKQVEKMTKVVETYGCWLNPLKWGQCSRDVLKPVIETVWEDVNKCYPEQLEVAHTAFTTIERMTPRVFDTSAVLNYRADVESLSLAIQGDRIKISATVNAPVSADIKQNLLVGNVTAKGALSCTSTFDVGAQATVSLISKGDEIGVAANLNSIDLDVNKFCVPGAVELTQAWSLSTPQNIAVSQFIKSTIQKAIFDSVHDAIAKQADGLTIGQELGRAAAALGGVHPLGSEVWLKVMPSKVRIGPVHGVLAGDKQLLRTSVALDANLGVTYGGAPALATPIATVPVSLEETSGVFKLAPRGMIPLNKMSDILRAEAQKWAAEPLRKTGFELGEIEVYQSGPAIVLGIQINSTSWWQPSGRIYLSGTPTYDNKNGTIVLEQFDFTADTSNWLVKNGLGSVHSFAVTDLAPKMVFTVDTELTNVTRQFANFSVPITGSGISGTISGTTAPPRLRTIWVDGGMLNFDLAMEGQAKFEAALFSPVE